MNYFTINELCASETAKKKKINNIPSKEITSHLNELIKFLNPIRESWGSAIRINSGYRCSELNKAVGGVSNSSHLKGWAADLYPVNGKYEEFKKFITDYLKDKEFDQCIIEKSSKSEWIHLGLKDNLGRQRKMIFKMNVK